MKSILPRVLLPLSLLVLPLTAVPRALAQEVAATQPSPTRITEDIHLLSRLGCNVVAITGPEGVLVIDNGRSRAVESLRAQVAGLESGKVTFAINTHFHYDHVGASAALGSEGATIIGHDNARTRMMAEWHVPETLGVSYPRIPPYPEVALPALTFGDTLKVHFNGLEIEAVHFSNAHSDSDVAVFIPDRNVLLAGDLYLSNGFPVLDSWHGGTIDGLLMALDGLLRLTDESTVVVPGHGSVSDQQGLRDYRDMLATGRDRIAELISQGSTLEEAVAADPTAGLYSGGESWLDPKLFIGSVYADLTREGPAPRN